MRKVLTVTAIAAIALGAVACAEPTPSPSATGTAGATSAPATTTAADQTKEVCTEALSTESTSAAAVVAKINEINQGANPMTVRTEVLSIVNTWKSTFADLAQRPIKPEVKASLDEHVTFLGDLSNQAVLSPDAVQSKFTEMSGKLTAACA
jgi:hypothetical protein